MGKTVTVVREFRDRESFAIVHSVGDTMLVDDGRAAELAALGLVKESRGEEVEAGGVSAAPAQPSPKRRRKTA